MASHALKFLGGTTATQDPAIAADVKAMSALPPAALEAVYLIVLRFITDAQKLDLVSAVDEAAAAHGLKARAARNVVRTLLFVLKGAVKYSVSGSALKDDLVSLGLEEERAAWVGSAWEVASLRVSVALGDKASDLDAGALIDAEWRFGVTVSTDDLARVGSTYLQMRLLTDSGAGRLDTHHLELTVPQFYDLLSQLEKAKSYCDYLQSA